MIERPENWIKPVPYEERKPAIDAKVDSMTEKRIGEEFAQILFTNYSSDEIATAGSALDGFKGKAGKMITEWMANDYGVLISRPARDPQRSDGALSPEGGVSRGIAYALPYTDENVTGDDKRVLLVAPNENGSFEVYLAGPRRNRGDRNRKDNILNQRAFDMIFSPSQAHYTVQHTWKSGRTPYENLLNNSDILSMDIYATPKGVTKEQMLQKALVNVRETKKRNMKSA